MKEILVRTTRREELIEITAEVARLIAAAAGDGGSGLVHLFVQHTTCGLTVNENADPDVQSDMLGLLRRLIPQDDADFRHFEHNSDAHIKASLIGPDVMVPFSGGRLRLGRWQGIFLCEFDGPRERKILLTVIRND